MAGRVHEILLSETAAPGAIEIRCLCGDVTWTPWGIDHAAEIGKLHLWEMMAQGAKRLPVRGTLRGKPQPQRR
jgi:hypothetical protein